MPVFSDSSLIDMILDGDLFIDPFILNNVQPSSIDLCLDPKIKIPKSEGSADIAEDSSTLFTEYTIESSYDLEPNASILIQTHETIGIPTFCNGHIHNRSSLVRIGLDVASASYINPGYKGKLPLLIKNRGNFVVKLTPYRRICQLELTKVHPVPLRDYSQKKDAKYFNEKDSLVSLIHRDMEIQEYAKNKDDVSLAQFLNQRIKEKSVAIVNNMSDSLKEKLGLL
jgi:dCTP deaminase